MMVGNLLKSHVSEIHVKRICVNQRVGVLYLTNWTIKQQSQLHLMKNSATSRNFCINYWFLV